MGAGRSSLLTSPMMLRRKNPSSLIPCGPRPGSERQIMRRFAIIALVAWSCCLFAGTSQGQPATLQGDWIGGFMFNGNWVALNVRFNDAQGSITGTANIVFTDYENESGLALTAIEMKGSRVHFEARMRSGKIVFDATQAAGTISGTYAYAGKSGRFGLTRIANVSADQRVKLYGAYRASGNRVISICDWDGFRMRFVEYKSGQHHSLYPLAEDTFFSGPGQAVSNPITLKVRFVKDSSGQVTKLLWRSGGGREQTATRINFQEEQLSFKNGDVTLGGTLITPLRKGPHPVIIVAPGDYRTNRNGLRFFAYNFLRRGVAAFIFDSRGAGASTGTAGLNTFSDLADDVLAGVEMLKTRPNVDARQIGLFGFSNSSYTVTLAASRSKSVAFLISQATSGLPGWQQETYRAETQIRLAGFPAEAVKNAVDFMKLKFEVARTGQGWDQVQATMEKYRNERWLPYTNPPRSLQRSTASWPGLMSYDPVTAFERLTCPAFIHWGELDSNMPVRASIPVIEQALKRAGNRDYTIKIFPKARHDLMQGVTGGDKEASRMTKFAPGYWDYMNNWLLKRVKLSGHRSEERRVG